MGIWRSYSLSTRRDRAEPANFKLGGVDEFEPLSDRHYMGHAHDAIGQLIVASGDCAIDFHPAEHAFDAVAIFVENRSCSIFTRRFDRPGMTALMCGSPGLCGWGRHRNRCPPQGFGRSLRQGDQGVKRLAIRRFANRQLEGERPRSRR